MHFAFFGRADSATRLRILEGRRSRLQERLETFRTSLQRTRERLDAYTLELQRHGLESVEREVRWLDGLIDAELRDTVPGRRPARSTHDVTRGRRSRSGPGDPPGGPAERDAGHPAE